MENMITCTSSICYERGVLVCGSELQNVFVGGSALLLQELLTRILWYLLSQVALLFLTFSVFFFSPIAAPQSLVALSDK